MVKKQYQTNILEIRRPLDRRRDNLCECLYGLSITCLDSIQAYDHPTDGVIGAGEIREKAESELVKLIPEKVYIDLRTKDQFAKKVEAHARRLFRKSDDYRPVT